MKSGSDVKAADASGKTVHSINENAMKIFIFDRSMAAMTISFLSSERRKVFGLGGEYVGVPCVEVRVLYTHDEAAIRSLL